MLLLITYLAQRGMGFLDVILHIGAHRTGTTSFQRALQQNQHDLVKSGVTFWGPRTTRSGRFSGLLGPKKPETEKLVERNRGVISIEIARLEKAGQKTLLVSEENILGSMRANLRATRLYPGLDERLSRFASVFGPVCRQIGLTIRPYEDYWSSTMAYAIKAGHQVFDEEGLDRLVTQPRSWRNVVSDVATAFPKARVTVWEFDRLIGKPQSQYRLMAGRRGRLRPMNERHNVSPGRDMLREVLNLRGDERAVQTIATGDGRYMPFGEHHLGAFQAQYQADLVWLRGQPTADFTFVEETEPETVPIKKVAGRGFR